MCCLNEKRWWLRKRIVETLLSSGLRNHRERREKRQRSVLSADSVVDFPCDEPFLQNKLKSLGFVLIAMGSEEMEPQINADLLI